jgi:hypothetical protein
VEQRGEADAVDDEPPEQAHEPEPVQLQGLEWVQPPLLLVPMRTARQLQEQQPVSPPESMQMRRRQQVKLQPAYRTRTMTERANHRRRIQPASRTAQRVWRVASQTMPIQRWTESPEQQLAWVPASRSSDSVRMGWSRIC